MENKQTAVEWLLDQMFNKNKLKYERGIQYILPELVEQAKQMEKEKMIKFANWYADTVINGFIITPEEYYNKTYGKL